MVFVELRAAVFKQANAKLLACIQEIKVINIVTFELL